MQITKSELKNLIKEAFESNTKKDNFDDDLENFKEELTSKALKRINELVKPLPNKLFTGEGTKAQFNQQGLRKSYNKIFGYDDNKTHSAQNWDSLDEFLMAIKNRDITPDSRLKAMSELIGSEGGFLLPEAFEESIWDSNLEAEIVRPRAKVFGLKRGKGNSITIPATSDPDHSSYEISGILSHWGPEAATKTKTKPELRQMSMKVNELYAYTESSDILIEDSGIPISDLVGKLFYQNLAWRLDHAFLRGTGAGQPMGILNANCTGTQNAESGQTPDTICYENLTGMISKLMPGSYKNACWIVETSCLPSLFSIGIKIGTAAHYVPVITGADLNNLSLLYRPLIITEKLPVVGDEGCLLLADFTQYMILIKEGGLRLETSKDYKFREDSTSFRMIARVDGQPALDSAGTILYSGSTVYPFVKLGTV